MVLKDKHKRIYRELFPQTYKRHKSRRITGPKMLLGVPTRPNQLWAMDFILDRIATGRRFRVLTLKDLFIHEALPLHVDFSITGKRVAEVLDRIKGKRGLPKGINCDNGSKYISKATDPWS